MDNFFYAVFEALDKATIRYCLLRGYEELAITGVSREVDLLVAPDHLPLLADIFATKGFVTIPSWGYAPHHFFVAYDQANDTWLKFDVVTDLRYGTPIRALRIDLTESCLHNRRYHEPTYVLSPADEFITLLLHCLLDKANFRPVRHARLMELYKEIAGNQIASRQLAKYVERYLAPMITRSMIAQAMDTGDWQSLMIHRSAIFRRLFWRDPVRNAWRILTGRLLRRMRPFLFAVYRQGLSVALLAPDGAGKTTLAQELARDDYLRARLIYMGTNIDTSTVGLPTTRWLHERLKSLNDHKWSLTQIVLKGLSFSNRVVEQWYRYGIGFYHKLRGRFVIFDRYVYDSFLSPRASTLGKRLRRWLIEGTCPSPDLVILLDAPGTLLYARKGEHTPERLERQRQIYLGLQEKVPNMIIVDATQEVHEVRRNVISLIWKYYGNRVRRKGTNGISH